MSSISPVNEKLQPNSTECPKEVVVKEESPGSLVPWIHSSPLPVTCDQKRNWTVTFMKEIPSEPKNSWAVENLSDLPVQGKRQWESAVEPEHHEVFNRLLADPVIQRFLAWDKTLRVSDKYLLSMVIAYFSRAGLFSWQYQRIHFFLALYLASDMEEDNQASKQAIFFFLYGKSHIQRPMFHKLRFQFIRSMHWKIWVSQEECEEIQAYDPEHWVWRRDRTLIP
ncbi:PREDICTED: speedy protein E4-like [Chrysochloris asiatica]|uniref:Speedy protein E4-like n=1 Tax=Chrysochloris asiatica TaxID=185453 RepID=A0A9B0WYN6_CHRAS|nr:PREDICTED: speedy protein E4-like [Chrysochloris asiatica]